MTAPTAAMIKAGAEWLRAVDASDDDPGYEAIALGIFRVMALAGWQEMNAGVSNSGSQQRWDDAVAREMVGKRRVP